MASKDSTALASPPSAAASPATKIRRRSLLRVRRPAWAQPVSTERKP